MAKDPAFLFYYQDFLVGTSFMTLEEMGAYIKLLCFQADRGPLQEKDILKKIPEPIWKAICCKFEHDEKGYYNERLGKEVERRRAFTASRRKNLHMEEHMESHMGGVCKPHMETVTETVNEDSNIGKPKKKKNVPPLKAEVALYCVERKNMISADAFMNHYDSKGWMIGKTKMTNWQAAIRTWELKDRPVKSAASKPKGTTAKELIDKYEREKK